MILPMVKFHRRLGLRTSEIFAMAYPWGRFPKGGGAEEYMAGFQFNGRDAVRIGFLANGSVSSMRPLLDWRNIMTTSPRDDLHDPLRPRIP